MAAHIQVQPLMYGSYYNYPITIISLYYTRQKGVIRSKRVL